MEGIEPSVELLIVEEIGYLSLGGNVPVEANEGTTTLFFFSNRLAEEMRARDRESVEFDLSLLSVSEEEEAPVALW